MCIWGFPNVIIRSNKSHLIYLIISLVYSWRIFIIIFYFSKEEEEKSGVYGDVNRDSKWNHKKRWPHLIDGVSCSANEK